MRCQARKRNARQRQRIDPDIAHVDAALDRFDERSVKRGVMRDDRAAAHKVGERRDSLDSRRGIRHIGVRNARELGNLCRNQLLGMHERIKTVNDLAAESRAAEISINSLSCTERPVVSVSRTITSSSMSQTIASWLARRAWHKNR